MNVGVPKETFPGEIRVALIPADIPALGKIGLNVLVEAGAGAAAGIPDKLYTDKGATIVESRDELFEKSELIVSVRTFGANGEDFGHDLERLRNGQTVIGFCEPLTEHDATKAAAEKGVTLLSMELMPRITRAQSMDALSSMATIAGYKAVLIAASQLPMMFPMLMTAAGTIQPAKVFVIGAGVAGLQACATANRLGAIVSAYDVRPVVKEQVQSVGAKFVELDLDTGDSEDKGGYAKAMDEEFYRRQREELAKVMSEMDVVISTAAIPGRPSPLLITEDAVKLMPAGSVIIDLASERGGNCALTKKDETVVEHDVTIIGPANLPASVPKDASQMYSRNVITFLKHLVEDGKLELDLDDEITAGTLVTKGGEVTHERVRHLMGMEPAEKPAEEAEEETDAPSEEKSSDTAEGNDASEASSDESGKDGN